MKFNKWKFIKRISFCETSINDNLGYIITASNYSNTYITDRIFHIIYNHEKNNSFNEKNISHNSFNEKILKNNISYEKIT